MKKIFCSAIMLCSVYISRSQDATILLQEAINLEHQLNEPAALEKYKQIATIKPGDISILVKCTELNCSIGGRQADKTVKSNFFELAESYAQKAFSIDSNNAAAIYAKALVAGKMTDIETDNKKMISFVKETFSYASRSLEIDPNAAKANYVLGKWHFEMTNLSWFKKTAVKLFYGGLPEAEIDSAITYMEKCKKLDPYFVLNYLDLAKAYQTNGQPAEAINILKLLIRLPNRTADDAALKEEGKALLEKLQ